jgi:hypothetical protein
MSNSPFVKPVIPAKAGIQLPCGRQSWAPAFAGVTAFGESVKEAV